jgi:NADPH-dependent 2,4-dienoyl-CoA reductase/sulfur reductase-like enzyme
MFDVLVVGGGPGGLTAANAAADATRVGLIDEQPLPGGQIWRGRLGERSENAILSDRVEFMGGSTVLDAPEPGVLLVLRNGLPSRIRYKKLILATGARELMLPFPGWTLPGVMGAGGLQAAAKCGLQVRGKKVVIGGSGPLLMAVAAWMIDEGADVLAVCEQAPLAQTTQMARMLLGNLQKLKQAKEMGKKIGKARMQFGTVITEAKGADRLNSVVIEEKGSRTKFECDFVGVGYGLVPNTELAELIGCELTAGFVEVDSRQETTVKSVYAVGELTGIGGLDKALPEGVLAGITAAGREPDEQMFKDVRRQRATVNSLIKAYALTDRCLSLADDDTIICRCEDTTLGQVKNCRSSREAKLAHRVGMGPCQGRICGAACTAIFGWEKNAVRPPLIPCDLAHLAAQDDPE